jgi:hypothetical protein
MSIGVFQFHLVARKRGNRFAAGSASQLPIRNGWLDIGGGDFGYWYGSQVNFQPYLKALQRAEELAEKLNEEEKQ